MHRTRGSPYIPNVSCISKGGHPGNRKRGFIVHGLRCPHPGSGARTSTNLQHGRKGRSEQASNKTASFMSWTPWGHSEQAACALSAARTTRPPDGPHMTAYTIRHHTPARHEGAYLEKTCIGPEECTASRDVCVCASRGTCLVPRGSDKARDQTRAPPPK